MGKEDFEILIKNIQRKLLSVARNFPLPSEIEADDVVQEAVVLFAKVDPSLTVPTHWKKYW